MFVSLRNLLVVSVFIGGLASPVLSAETAERWSEARANAWYEKQPWPVGFNFLPSTAVNSTEMWQADTFDTETIDRELRWASEIGFNTCRVYLPYLVWDADTEAFKTRMERFLDIAESHGISVTFVHFCDCAFSKKEPYLGKQAEPMPGVHNSGWTPSPGLERVTDESVWPRLQEYVQDTIRHFSADPRVLLWDVYNEPGNSEMKRKSLPLLEASFAWAREVAPDQPITSGVWTPELPEINRFLLDNSDVISFHAYDEPAEVMRKAQAMCAQKRPVFCTEWLRRGVGNTFEELLPFFKREGIAAYNWGLVGGRTQTYYPWGSQAGAPEPNVWQHDLLRDDGTPFDAKEIALIKQLAWKPLFNGQNLDGWEISGLSRWRVEEGVLIGRQGPNRESGDLLTVVDYDDFLLTMTYRMVWPANSGIWFRYQSANQAFQADILEYKNPVAWSGSLYCTGKMFIGLNEDPSIVDREGWNTMTVLADGERLVVHLNGHKTVDVRDDTSTHGKIGFQIHAGDQFETMAIHIRDFRIRSQKR